MCYHTHYIFLWCGHSITARHPIHPSPPCPIRRQSTTGVKETETSISPRPFSFDPSVIAHPISPLPEPEPFPSQTPWRLERPFSTPESPSPLATTDEDPYFEERQGYRRPNLPRSKVATAYEQENLMPQQQSRRQKRQLGKHGNDAPATSCGQVHIHPYRTYKIEGLCLHCRKRRDTALASFEANAIRESVYRESVFESENRMRAGRRFEAIAEREHAEHRGLKSIPTPIVVPPISMSVLGEHMEFREQDGYQQQDRQQTPWRLTLPPARPPRTGNRLEGMRDGEWI